jgi:hypothetical protein
MFKLHKDEDIPSDWANPQLRMGGKGYCEDFKKAFNQRYPHYSTYEEASAAYLARYPSFKNLDAENRTVPFFGVSGGKWTPAETLQLTKTICTSWNLWYFGCTVLDEALTQQEEELRQLESQVNPPPLQHLKSYLGTIEMRKTMIRMIEEYSNNWVKNHYLQVGSFEKKVRSIASRSSQFRKTDYVCSSQVTQVINGREYIAKVWKKGDLRSGQGAIQKAKNLATWINLGVLYDSRETLVLRADGASQAAATQKLKEKVRDLGLSADSHLNSRTLNCQPVTTFLSVDEIKRIVFEDQ